VGKMAKGSTIPSVVTGHKINITVKKDYGKKEII
jgi:hypothetical protein